MTNGDTLIQLHERDDEEVAVSQFAKLREQIQKDKVVPSVTRRCHGIAAISLSLGLDFGTDADYSCQLTWLFLTAHFSVNFKELQSFGRIEFTINSLN